jgi:hypothetical protein
MRLKEWQKEALIFVREECRATIFPKTYEDCLDSRL